MLHVGERRDVGPDGRVANGDLVPVAVPDPDGMARSGDGLAKVHVEVARVYSDCDDVVMPNDESEWPSVRLADTLKHLDVHDAA